MLGNFLDWVSGEHTEATANDSAENELLLNNQTRKARGEVPSPLPLCCLPAPISDVSLLLRSTPDQSLRQQPLQEEMLFSHPEKEDRGCKQGRAGQLPCLRTQTFHLLK